MFGFSRKFSSQTSKTLKVSAFLSVVALMGLSLPVAMAQSPKAPQSPKATPSAAATQPGLFFTIQNGCSSAVRGFAVGDELCLLQIGSATFTRAIFQGTLAPGGQEDGMACAGADGNGKVIFVPSAGTATDAVIVTVKPDSVVKVPENFCGNLKGAPRDQLKKQK